MVQQLHENACVAAVGEMLTNGTTKQEILWEAFKAYHHPELLARMTYPTADLKWLANELGQEWRLAGARPIEAQNKLYSYLDSNQPWAAEFRDQGKIAHLVVVDGLNDLGQIMIRDPAKATRYELAETDFLSLWNGRSLHKVR